MCVAGDRVGFPFPPLFSCEQCVGRTMRLAEAVMGINSGADFVQDIEEFWRTRKAQVDQDGKTRKLKSPPGPQTCPRTLPLLVPRCRLLPRPTPRIPPVFAARWH